MNMRRTRIFVFLGVGLLALGVGLFYWFTAPQLVEISPADGARAVLAGAEIHLTFSRPMQGDSVLERLTIEPSQPGEFHWQGNTLLFTPTEPWPSGETVNVRLQPGARASGNLPFVTREEYTWSFSINQPRLAYLYPDSGPADIYILDPLSGTSQRMTQSADGVQDFQTTTNGTALYYSARLQGGSALFRLDLTVAGEDIDPTLVLDCPRASCRGVAVSPDSAYLAYEHTAFVGGDQPSFAQVWILPLASDGLAADNPTPFLAGAPTHQTLSPTWSADGALAYYDATDSQFIFQTLGGEVLARLSNQTGEQGDWHPNGRDFVVPEINFIQESLSQDSSEQQSLANSQLMLFNIADGSLETLSRFEDLEDTAPVFSPDGGYLVFARKYLSLNQWTPGRQIWLMRTGAWEAKPLTEEPLYNHFDFAWSPASDILAYVRFNESVLNEPTELWVMDPTTTRATPLLIGGYAPQWIP